MIARNPYYYEIMLIGNLSIAMSESSGLCVACDMFQLKTVLTSITAARISEMHQAEFPPTQLAGLLKMHMSYPTPCDITYCFRNANDHFRAQSSKAPAHKFC